MKTLLTFIITTCTVLNMQAQTSSLKRNVLFTLGQNEKIYYNEYIASQQFSQNRFACIVQNTQNKTMTVVINGKRLQTVKYDKLTETTDYGESYLIYPLHVEIFYFDPEKENGYGYRYELAGRSFVNIGGKVIPNINPVAIYYAQTTKSGEIAFCFYNNRGNFVYVNGKIFGPYYNILHVCTSEDGKYIFAYQLHKDAHLHVNIDGKIFGPYHNIPSATISENGNYAYIYDTNTSSEYRLNVKGTDVRTFPKYSYIKNTFIVPDGGFAACYGNAENTYITVNDKTYGPYSSIYDVKIADKNNFGFQYYIKNTDMPYYHVNGNDNASAEAYNSIKPNDIKNNLRWYNYGVYQQTRYETTVETMSADRQHSFFSDYAYEYVVIDGQPVGKSPALYAWYNKSSNSFVWNSIEGKELVVYEYMLP